MPPLSQEEMLELTKIYSIMGLLQPEKPLITVRPFREVHHSVTRAALIGGGRIPVPGECTLAHGGVLFLDELPEMSRRVLELLNENLPPHDYPEWKEWVFSHKEIPLKKDDILHPHEILETIQVVTDGDAIITTDVGQHQMWCAQYYHFSRPGQFIPSGGFGTMGFGLGAAMGAAVGNPGKVVVQCTGDGCFRMNCHELATLEHYHIPVITVIFNNGTLGMVRQWQHLIYHEHYSQTTLDRGPDFVKLAQAYGLKGKRVANRAEMEQALQEALSCGCGYVIDCQVDMDEMVRPMVPGGGRITQFLVD